MMRWCRADVEARLDALGRDRNTLILTHDYADPDGIAAAVGLARLFEVTRHHTVTLASGGFISRAENRAMVQLLEIPLINTESLDFGAFDHIVLVDTQPGTGNNSSPAHLRPSVVIDHHPALATAAGVPWCDIREDVGATATIVLEYLRLLGIPYGPKLATAFFYALKSETQDLVRETHDDDVDAYRHLFPAVDRALLGAITRPAVGSDYFRLLSRAVDRARITGRLLTVDLQSVPFPEIVAEVADLMSRHEGIGWVLAVGQVHGALYLSARSREGDPTHAGELLCGLVGKDGTAGGHATMAGGKIPVSDLAAARAMVDSLFVRMKVTLGLDGMAERGIATSPLTGA